MRSERDSAVLGLKENFAVEKHRYNWYTYRK